MRELELPAAEQVEEWLLTVGRDTQATTIAALKALPTRAVVRDRMGWLAVLADELLEDARAAYMSGLPGVRVVWKVNLPLTVIHLPGEDEGILSVLAAADERYFGLLAEQFESVGGQQAGVDLDRLSRAIVRDRLEIPVDLTEHLPRRYRDRLTDEQKTELSERVRALLADVAAQFESAESMKPKEATNA